MGIGGLREAGGDEAVEGFYAVARDLEFRPDFCEVVELAETMTRTGRELASVVRQEGAGRVDQTPRLCRDPRAN